VAARTILWLLAAALLLPLAGCGDDGESGGQEASADAGSVPVRGGCKVLESPEPRADGGASKPSTRLAAGTTYDVVLTTSCGSFTIRLDQKTSPNATASFAALVRSGFYDGTVFHRIVPEFVIQGGDPTGRGTGTPGYSTRDRPPLDTAYLQGNAAMAKAGNDPAGTAGSQFFVVTGRDSGLTPDYAPLGKVVEGMNVVLRIGRLGDPASGSAGTPKRTVVLERAKLIEH
jgi:peptidyl-prolyl cis-trans isomerase B (cyclophilin B)